MLRVSHCRPGELQHGAVVLDPLGGNLRLRDGTGSVRVKLGARQGRTALLLFNEQIEPAVEVMSDAREGTVLTLTANDRKRRVIRP